MLIVTYSTWAKKKFKKKKGDFYIDFNVFNSIISDLLLENTLLYYKGQNFCQWE